MLANNYLFANVQGPGIRTVCSDSGDPCTIKNSPFYDPSSDFIHTIIPIAIVFLSVVLLSMLVSLFIYTRKNTNNSLQTRTKKGLVLAFASASLGAGIFLGLSFIYIFYFRVQKDFIDDHITFNIFDTTHILSLMLPTIFVGLGCTLLLRANESLNTLVRTIGIIIAVSGVLLLALYGYETVKLILDDTHSYNFEYEVCGIAGCPSEKPTPTFSKEFALSTITTGTALIIMSIVPYIRRKKQRKSR